MREYLLEPEIFQVNRLEAHSDHRYYSSLEEAKKLGEEPFKSSLNGNWQFAYAKNPSSRIVDFYTKTYDASGWDTIKVPGHIQLQGYDKPQYVNTMYPWDGHNALLPPQLPKDYNAVGSYIKTFTVPKEWKDSPVYISFQGVESAFYMWINGEFVGYSEDSFTPSEFDITPYLVEGENKLAVEVYKWCSGSWLEDQDFWRLSGIFRDVYLYTVPKIHLKDLKVETDLEDNYTQGILKARLLVNYREALNAKLQISLVDAKGNTVYEKPMETISEEMLGIEMSIGEVQLWSAETPYLYTLYLTFIDETSHEVIEVVPQKVGFRKFEMLHKVMHLNGKRIVFKGVNRHEFSCHHGRSVTKEEMLWDIKFLKQNNFNAVRTSHYPNQSYWYELCDTYGIYLIDEVNLESHGTWMKQGKVLPEHAIPDNKPEWLEIVIDRTKSMFERDKNHPSILIWSCGNESYGGENIFKMSEWLRQADPTRLVHYEGVFHDRRYNATSDMESRMYAKVTEIEDYLEDNPQKPFILCEYTHSMGNSNGGMHKYIALEEKYPLYQGGFIWDYIDQGILTKNTKGIEYIAFGGDFEDRPTNYNFCGNGIVYADRRPTPKMQEVKYLYQDFKLILDQKGILIKNQSLFTNTEDFLLKWELRRNGYLVAQETTSVAVPPLGEKYVELKVPENIEAGEYAITASFLLGKQTLWGEVGHEVAYGQCIFNVAGKEVVIGAMEKANIANGDEHVGIKGNDFSILFNKQSGAPISIVYGGKEFIDTPLMPEFWRAVTDNDKGNGMAYEQGMWKLASLYAKLIDLAVVEEDTYLEVNAKYDLGAMAKAYCEVHYQVDSTGIITVKMSYEGYEGLPAMPNFGMSFRIPSAYEKIRWYGNGPEESYSDRKHGARLGIFESTVEDSMADYLVPQACGNKTEVRWAEVTDAKGCGIKIASDTPFEWSALPYTCHELEQAYHAYELPPIYHTVVTISAFGMGVGGDDSWGAPVHEEYCIASNKPRKFAFTIAPVK